MSAAAILLPVAIPAIAGAACLLVPDRARKAKEAIAILAAAAALVAAALLLGREERISYAWAPEWGIDFSFRLYGLSGFIVLAASGFALAVALYSWSFMEGKGGLKRYFAFLLFTLAQVNGAALADNLAVMLIFWESLLLTLYGMIAMGVRGDGAGARGAASKTAYRGAHGTAVKAFAIAGVTDLCMTLGIVILWKETGSLEMSSLRASGSGLGGLAFVLLVVGAISKAGSMPFHSWIPDAAQDAPLAFMAYVPAALEKLLGIYFLSRIVLDFYAVEPGSWLSMLLMIVGAATILLAVLMALVQKEYKKLLSYHAISQVGYMILGIGTCVPVGMVGGIFHMINHAIYKSGLFLTAGAVERQAGTTSLERLGGLARKMPVTFACFLVTAASISGVPPFNGFFSKELIYDGALERGWIFYAAALLGSILTAASFLKLGHAAYFGKRTPESEAAREAPPSMLVPMVAIACFCAFFGLGNAVPIDKVIAPAVSAARISGHEGPGLIDALSGWPRSPFLVGMTLAALAIAALNHWYGSRRSGSGLGAADHIHYAPGLRSAYAAAEKGLLDPFNIGMRLILGFAAACRAVDRAIDWFYDRAVVEAVALASSGFRRLHTGSHARYILWSLAGILVLVAWMASA
jgi:formate hydrogenlyase subunit 3/multisubunit Na+/H+ antiporter MnhD subunit